MKVSKFRNLEISGVMLLALLAGCGVAPLRPISVPLPVACQETEPDRPAMPTEALAPGVPLDTYVKASQAEIERREGYEVQLVTALRACIKPLVSSPSK